MTDKQLEEYTRLKIEEATRDLEAQNKMFQKTIIDLEKEKGIKPYRYSVINQNLFLSNPVESIVYVDDNHISREMKTLHEFNETYLTKQESFEKNSLITRLKKAFKSQMALMLPRQQ